ncbi:GTP 3',8-cyclase MoaA [Candidatus Acetothermia bacterium]|nr:GTP 3',8-cyclase MoaA [Candidatus Acetothermia bacterium]MBI3644162.1 GTP 3',8-cyclase MoaA [Candidatus Acetothermia bacterium]
MMEFLKDRYGRRVNYLRISVTDRCNLRCHYCMPLHGLQFHKKEEILSFEEIVHTVQIANRLGIDRARLTGGEPLVRRDLPVLIKMLRNETDLKELSLTTNGLLLERLAEELATSGLDWINVSLDSLRPDRFTRITRFGLLETVWAGLRRATEVGLKPIKINTLVLKNFNEDEVEDWLDLTMNNEFVVRFLELMPIGEGADLTHLGGFANLSEIRNELIEKFGLVPAKPGRGNGPARYWKVPGAKGMIGFILPISEKYCDTCNRFRLTANGEIRPCLAYDVHVKLLDVIRAGDEDAIRAGFLEAADMKPEGHHWEVGQVTQTLMSSLGG